MKVELGITSFADNNDIITEEGRQPALSAAQRLRIIIEEIGNGRCSRLRCLWFGRTSSSRLCGF